MKKVDWMLAENHRVMDEMKHRTEVEDEAFELMAQGKFDEARELVETLDDSLLEIREWPGEEESEIKKQKENKKYKRKYIPFLEEAEKLAKENEELTARGYVKTEGFEKTIAFLVSMTQIIWKLMQKNESFRMELFYDAKALNTNYCFFTSTNEYVSDDTKLED